jgi:hypothetical protein
MRAVLRTLAVLAVVTSACTDPVSPPGPWLVTVTNAPPVSAKPGAVLPEVTLRFADVNGTPAAGRPVRATGDGVIELSSDVTDGSGRVRVKWSLPRWPGVKPRAFSPGLPGEFSLSIELGAGEASVDLTTAARVFTADQVDASGGTACGVRELQLWCWGSVGPPLVPQRLFQAPAVRINLPAGVEAREVRMNDRSVCIRDSLTDQPWCIDLFQGPGEFRPVPGAPRLMELVDRGDGYCGRATADRRVWCWLMPGGGPGEAMPMETPIFRVFTGQSTGFYDYRPGGHLCGLTDDGAVWCWGKNDDGQVGDGTTMARSMPVPVALPEPLVTLRASRGGACGQTADGQVWCWGRQLLGNGILGPQRVIVPGTGPVVPGWIAVYRIGPTGIDRYFRGQFLPRFPAVDEAMRIVEFAGEVDACGVGVSGEVWCSNVITDGISDSWGDSGDLFPVHEP